MSNAENTNVAYVWARAAMKRNMASGEDHRDIRLGLESIDDGMLIPLVPDAPL